MFLLLVLFAQIQQLPFPEQADIFLEVHKTQGYQGKVLFFAPHEDEHVVNDYLVSRLKQLGGLFVILRQDGERNLKFQIQGQTVLVDPNRIFTPLGVKDSVETLNPDLKDPEVLKEAEALAYKIGLFILKSFGPLTSDTVLVAIHNNTQGYEDDGKGGLGTISMKRYQKKLNNNAKYIKKLHHGMGDEDDLFFINYPPYFEEMRKAGWNIVLQHPQVATLEDEDDGSLSVYAEKIGCRYINLEAERELDGVGSNHLKESKTMLDFVFRLVY